VYSVQLQVMLFARVPDQSWYTISPNVQFTYWLG